MGVKRRLMPTRPALVAARDGEPLTAESAKEQKKRGVAASSPQPRRVLFGAANTGVRVAAPAFRVSRREEGATEDKISRSRVSRARGRRSRPSQMIGLRLGSSTVL